MNNEGFRRSMRLLPISRKRLKSSSNSRSRSKSKSRSRSRSRSRPQSISISKTSSFLKPLKSISRKKARLISPTMKERKKLSHTKKNVIDKFFKYKYFNNKSPIKERKKLSNERQGILFQNLQSENLVKFLKLMCSDSCGCLTFGHETEKINHLFGYFRDFQYAKKEAKRVGKVSANGYVYEIEYRRHNYISNALLKSSIEKNSDNLYYEYLVGIHFLNKMNRLLPCFTETYHILLNNSKDLKNEMKKNSRVELEKIKNNYEFIGLGKNENNVVDQSCLNSEKLAILVQYINNPISFDDYLRMPTNEFYLNDLTQILYQIYGPLSRLSTVYTHYDLHSNNVLLYKLDNKQYVTMKYIYKSTVITFKTNYIAKIIDYGRSFFHTNNKLNSKQILKNICSNTTCTTLVERKKEQCGDGKGYSWMNCDGWELNHYICSSRVNESHDLRLANIVKEHFMSSSSSSSSQLGLAMADINYDEDYGTKPMESTEGSTINNVVDLENRLKRLIFIPENGFLNVNNKKYEGHRCIGELHVFIDKLDKEMVYIPTARN
jgi:hypothetical protein